MARIKRDGIKAPLCWYRSMVDQVQYEAEKDLPPERFAVNVPYLFVAASKDVLSSVQAIERPKAMGLLPKLTVTELDAPHWSMLEKPKEMGETFLKWLGEIFWAWKCRTYFFHAAWTFWDMFYP